MFMAMLIVMIPIYSASVYAGLSNAEAKGSVGINGFVKDNDSIDFKVYASIANDTITPNQVRLGTFFNFSSCTPSINDFICILKYPSTGTTEFLQKSTPYTINLYNDSGDLVSTYSGSVTLDKKAPDLAFTASPSLASSGNITLAYTFTDSDSADSGCVGIGKINIYRNGTANSTISISNASCSYAGEYKIAVDSLADGEYIYYAQASDRFGQASSLVSASFSIDKTNVVINTTSLKVVNSEGNEINYAGAQAIPATASFSIIAYDLDKSSVKGDLSALNYNEPSYASLTASCGSAVNNVTQCSWPINILLNSSGTKNIYLNASDSIGNKATATLTKSFTYDNVGPVVTSLVTDYYWDNKFFVGPLNEFTATFTETSGLNKTDVYLDLSEIGSSVKTADNCTKSETILSAYTCYWNNIAASGSGAAEIAITQSSKDIFGNYINGSYAINVTIDAAPPAVVSINVTPIGGFAEAYGNYTKTGDSLQIIANISEGNYLAAAKADFSAIISDNINIEGICNEEGDYWICEWITMPINISGYISSNLIFNFTDISGNSKIYSKPITVFEPVNMTVDYWEHSLSCSPELVDRAVTPLINQKVYCHIDLESEEAETISFTFDNQLCMGETINDTSSLSYLSDIELFNSYSGSEDIYLLATLARGDMKINNISFICPVYIYSKAGNKVTGIPEEENVSVNIEFYNFPLGEYSSDVQAKIDDSKDFAFYIGDWVETVDKLLNYGRKICQLYNTVLQLSQLWNKFTLLLSLVGKPFPMLEGTRTGQQLIVQRMQATGKEAWGGISAINKFCKFMSCRLFYDDVWGKAGPGGDSLGDQIGDWQRGVLDNANWFSTAGMGDVGGKTAYTTDYKNTNTGFETTGKTSVLDPKDSIVLSTLTLCLPGIIYNLNKLRQIQCMYADCVQNYATEGLPLKACEDAKHYAECKYWWGEIFQLLPFTGMINYFVNLVKQALSSPWGFVDIVLGYVCNSIILTPEAGEWAYACLVNDVFGLIAEVWQDLEGIGEGWKVENDYCGNID